MLLQYKGFMKLEHGQKPSKAVKLWFFLVKTLSGRKPATYNFQGVLPGLPVPPIRQTCEKYLLTVKPLLSEAEFAEMERKAKRFLEKDAWKLQVGLAPHCTERTMHLLTGLDSLPNAAAR